MTDEPTRERLRFLQVVRDREPALRADAVAEHDSGVDALIASHRNWGSHAKP